MPVNLHIKRGLEFKKDLYDSSDRKPWAEAVGKEIETKGLTLTLGDKANAIEVKNADDLVSFFDAYQKDPDAVATQIGLPAGREVSEYVRDLVEALDDVVKPTSAATAGDSLDLTTGSELSKALGISDASARYASSRTEFGQQTAGAPDGSMSVLGVQLSRTEAVGPGGRPPLPPELQGVTFIDAATFGDARPQTGRNSKELETVRRLSGLEASEIVELARREIRPGRTALDRMRKAKNSEAFSLGYSGVGYDEMRWDSDAHRVREALPYLSLTVESGRLERDDNDAELEVSQGTDYFADTQYIGRDPNDPTRDLLEEADNETRARIRYDEPGSPRRILVQAKMGSVVDEAGNKSAAKADIRDDSPTDDEIAGMDNMVRSGKSTWGWNNSDPQPIEAMKLLYESQKEAGKLLDFPGYPGVLILDEGPHIFSQRSRYHLNETRSRDIKNLFEQGETWINEVKDLIGQNPDPSQFADLSKQADALLDKSAVLERVRDDLAPLLGKDAADVTIDDVTELWPREVSWGANPDKADAAKRKVVAHAVSDAYHRFSEAFDDAKSDIADRGRSMRFGDEFIDWAKTDNPDLEMKTTPEPFLKWFDEQMAGPDKDDFIKRFATYLQNEENESDLADAADPTAAMGEMRKDLVREHLDILHRQVEASGTAATQLWFNEARDAHAGIDPTTWNFLIDTFDFVQNISPKDWATLTPEQKDGREPIPADKIYNADIVAEVQIELGYEKPYTEAIAEAQGNLDDARAGLFMDFALEQASSNVIADDPASFADYQDSVAALPDGDREALLEKLNQFAADKGSPLTFSDDKLGRLSEELFTDDFQGLPADGHASLVADLETANFMLDTITGAQNYIADLRGQRVLREADRAGFNGAEWDETSMSKGEKAKALLRELQQ